MITSSAGHYTPPGWFEESFESFENLHRKRAEPLRKVVGFVVNEQIYSPVTVLDEVGLSRSTSASSLSSSISSSLPASFPKTQLDDHEREIVKKSEAMKDILPKEHIRKEHIRKEDDGGEVMCNDNEKSRPISIPKANKRDIMFYERDARILKKLHAKWLYILNAYKEDIAWINERQK
jgi:hypothetical protein